jgi:tetratricopeptide (TPR) repeat protein
MPIDCQAEEGAGTGDDLYLWDLDANKEIRLSRGGGFSTPSVAGDNLYFLARKTDPRNAWRQRLRQVSLAGARKFAFNEAEPAARGLEEWTALLESACTAAKVPADTDGRQLDADKMTALADAFRQRFRERFKAEAPDTAAGLDRLGRELQGLAWGRKERSTVLLVFGAVQGDYLRRKHGATWSLSAGPLVPGRDDDEEGPIENAFARAVNPFGQFSMGGLPDDDDDEPAPVAMTLEALVQRLEGRALILVNDPAKGREAVAQRVDPDLARGADLLKQGKSEEGEQVLLGLCDREGHARNGALTFQAGKLLHEHGRKTALLRLLERPAVRDAGSAGLYNLMGLALIDGNARQAINAFKKSIRCDLRYGPAYFNLAAAYDKNGEKSAARQCLRRYLELYPAGMLSDEALERLGRLDAK